MSELSLRPEDWLAHRAPFLFLDEMLEIYPGRRAVGRWTLREDLDFFTGHFPHQPVTPGVLLIESLAQCGAVAVLSDPRYHGSLPLFGGIDSARFRRQVLPGDTVTLECDLSSLSSRGGKGHGVVRRGDEVCATADIFFVIAPAP